MIPNLADLALKYRSDKCPAIKHHHTQFYQALFEGRRETVRKVVEIGIGNPLDMEDPTYTIGASLFMWRDFFPNAQIYGADIRPELLFEGERIETILCDQTRADDLRRLIDRTGNDIDLFIDDGLHHHRSQVFTCQTVMPMLPEGATYIIEDVGRPHRIVSQLPEYTTKVLRPSRMRTADDRLVMVRRKPKGASMTLEYVIAKYGLDPNGRSPIIVDATRLGMAHLFNELGFKTGVEIGVERGVYSEYLCTAIPGLKLFCVDPWLAYTRYKDHVSQSRLDGCYEEAKARLAPYDCTLIRKPSLEAVKEFAPNSLDFCYIDGNHEFEFIVNDLIQWSRIVRPGGIVSGHDYRRDKGKLPFHVIQAVNAYIDAYKIRPLFQFRKDRSSTWAWVKP